MDWWRALTLEVVEVISIVVRIERLQRWEEGRKRAAVSSHSIAKCLFDVIWSCSAHLSMYNSSVNNTVQYVL